MQLTGYPLLLLLFLFAAITPFLLMGLAQVVQVKYPTPLKDMTYESGMAPFGDSHVQFDVKFYLYALLFILFDIESIFLFPWAVAFRDLITNPAIAGMSGVSLFPIVEMFLFIAILMVGLVYAWKRGALRWQ